MRKQGFEFSFAWLFALIVGALIIFLAIYGVTKLIGNQKTVIDVKTGKEFGILTNALETGFEESKTNSITMPTETRLYNRCDSRIGAFGIQAISTSQKSFGEWTKTDLEVAFPNKYFFSDAYEEGKLYYLFSKQFEFPYKVADLIFISSSTKKYCFKDLGEDDLELKDIYSELSGLGQKNILIGDCGEGEVVKICFGEGDCDIYVDKNGNQGTVSRQGEQGVKFYGDALMYAAIFSDEEVYDCQLIRLMKRTAVLAELYQEKANFVERTGCTSGLNTELMILISDVKSLQISSDLSINMVNNVESLKNKNGVSSCGLW